MNIRDFVKKALADTVAKAKTYFAKKEEGGPIVCIDDGIPSDLREKVIAVPKTLLLYGDRLYYPSDQSEGDGLPLYYYTINSGNHIYYFSIDWSGDPITFDDSGDFNLASEARVPNVMPVSNGRLTAYAKRRVQNAPGTLLQIGDFLYYPINYENDLPTTYIHVEDSHGGGSEEHYCLYPNWNSLTYTTQMIEVATNEMPSLNSPTLTGTPTAPTATAGTNTTQIATTAFVQTAISGKVSGPSSATADHVAVFDGTTGKLVKDAGTKLQWINGNNDSIKPNKEYEEWISDASRPPLILTGAANATVYTTGEMPNTPTTWYDAGTKISVNNGATYATILGAMSEGDDIYSLYVSNTLSSTAIANVTAKWVKENKYIANGKLSVCEGFSTVTGTPTQDPTSSQDQGSGYYAHAEGNATVASGSQAHSEGLETKASGSSSHAEGNKTIASGGYCHSEGYYSSASASGAHAEGWSSSAQGEASHAEGYNTVASNSYEHAEGTFNKSNKKTTGTTAEKDAGSTRSSIGIGTNGNSRTNAFEVMRNGDVYIKGIGSYNGTNPNTSGISTLQSIVNSAVTNVSYNSGTGKLQKTINGSTTDITPIITSHQSVSSSTPAATWGSSVQVGTVGGTGLGFVMPANPATGKADKNGSSSEDFSAALLSAASLKGGVRILDNSGSGASIQVEDAFIIFSKVQGASVSLPSGSNGQTHLLITTNGGTLYGPIGATGPANMRIFYGNGVGMYTSSSLGFSAGEVFFLAYGDGYWNVIQIVQM